MKKFIQKIFSSRNDNSKEEFHRCDEGPSGLQIETAVQHAETVLVEGGNTVVGADIAYVRADEATVHAHTITNLKVKVVHVDRTEEASSEEIELYVDEFRKCVNERSLVESSGGITDSYRDQNLTEPEREFTPQLKKIKFYKGEWVPRKKGILKKIRGTMKKSKKSRAESDQQYIKEESFVLGTGATADKDFIQASDILSFHLNERTKAIVGQAGSGKTTLMKRLSRTLLLEHNAEKEVIHFLNIRDIPVSDDITPWQLLFGKVLPEMSDEALKHGFHWLRENQSKAVFFLDGLDQAAWSLLDRYNKIRYTDVTSTSIIIQNLLDGSLFPDIQIIISSREHALSPLEGNLRPQVVIGLAGFTMEDRKEVFIELAGEDGENLWKLMCTKSPALVPLGSIPVFLVFIVIVYKFDPENPPVTMSGVMIKILQIFLQSDHAHERRNLLCVIESLKQMSFKGTKEARVLFTMDDLKSFNLIRKTVCDLIVFVPGSTLLGKNLMEGHYRLFFCHQSIQEMLTALCITEMTLEKFQSFAESLLHDSHWSVVRRFVCGVLLNEETYNDACDGLIKVSDIEEKRSFLKKSLAMQVETNQDSRQCLELFAAFYETDDSEFIEGVVHEIRFSHTLLTPNDMNVVTSVLCKCSEITLLLLSSCYLTDDILQFMSNALNSANVKIRKIDIHQNPLLGHGGLKAVGSIVSCTNVRELNISGCNIGPGKITGFLDEIKSSKIEVLDLQKNNICNVDFTSVCNAALHGKIQNLCMDDFILQKAESSPGCSLQVGKLRVKARKLQSDQMKVLGEIVNGFDEMEIVEMKNCSLDEEVVRIFRENVGDRKIKCLNVSLNRGVSMDCLAELGTLLQQSRVEQLHMREMNLKCEDIESLSNFLENSEVRKLDLSGYSYVGENRIQAILNLVERVPLEELVIVCWSLSEAQKQKISKSAVNKKFLLSSAVLVSSYSFNDSR